MSLRRDCKISFGVFRNRDKTKMGTVKKDYDKRSVSSKKGTRKQSKTKKKKKSDEIITNVDVVGNLLAGIWGGL